jgi:hypothetical protein
MGGILAPHAIPSLLTATPAEALWVLSPVGWSVHWTVAVFVPVGPRIVVVVEVHVT